MIKEQQVINFMKEKAYKPMNIHELREALGIDSGDELTELILLLNRMEDDGLVVRTRTHCYGLPEKMNLVVGTLQGKSKGFGFVIPDQREQEDVFIQAGDMAGALHGDRVIARIHRRGNGPRLEGVIIRILKRTTTRLVGTLVATEHYAFVKPDDPRYTMELLIPKENLAGAKDGQKVVAEITHYPEEFRAPEGNIVEVLGNPDAPGVDILSVIRKFGLPEEFPDEVLDDADHVPEQIAEEEIRERRDLREWRMVTIDGEDAKDLDDAVNVRVLENGNILLGVHIADVAYYVREGSALDKEAYERGTSVYLVDRVIPMLPKRLSNGICSLNPQVDRLTLTCEMEWTPHAEKVRHQIYASVIRTNERMTYSNVKKILVDRDPELMERYRDLVDDFILMEELAVKLRARRLQRGAIDFEFEETKIIVDERGKPVVIKKRERTIAEQIIEEFMLAANESVAEEFHRRGIPFLYRVHETPDAERLDSLGEFVRNFGYTLQKSSKSDSITPKMVQELLEKVKGTPAERVISTIALRSMKQARYAPEALGHYGLAAEFYSHFTSPIRRYPDLQIHRIIRETLVEEGFSDARLEHYRQILSDVAQHSSERERNAVEAERETDQLKKVEFMEDKIGYEFEGVVSGVAQFGIYVELDNSIEGLIHVSYLADDYYHYHERAYALIGERTGRSFRIGDRVRVRVAGVNKEQRQIDFALLEGGYVRGQYVERDASPQGGRSKRTVLPATGQVWNPKRPVPLKASKKDQRAKKGKNGKRMNVAEPFYPEAERYETPDVHAQKELGLPSDYGQTAGALEEGNGDKKRRKAKVASAKSASVEGSARYGRKDRPTRGSAADPALDGARPVFGKVRDSQPVTAAESKSRNYTKVSRPKKSRKDPNEAPHEDVYQPKRSPVGSAARNTSHFYDIFLKKKR